MGRENAKNIQKTNKICYCFGGEIFPPKGPEKNIERCYYYLFPKHGHQLGRFDPKHCQPRPLLVSLIHSSDVQTILANRSKLSKPIVIKSSMSPEERINESLLLKVRWNLIQQGMER